MKKYSKPTIFTEKSFETSALACGKTATPPTGSHHFASAYDTFTGHMGSSMGASESQSGAIGVGYGPGGTSQSGGYASLCGTWCTMMS